MLSKCVRLIFRIWLSFSATSFIPIIFFYKEDYQLVSWGKEPRLLSFVLYLFIPVILTGISFFLQRFLSNSSIEHEPKSIELANNSFLPSYLGYFFVALSIPDIRTLLFVYLIIFVFTYNSQTTYFNPVYLIWGYHFYFLTTIDDRRILVITRKQLSGVDGAVFPRLKRINDFCFIDQSNEWRKS